MYGTVFLLELRNVGLYFLPTLKIGSTIFSADINNYLHCGFSIFILKYILLIYLVVILFIYYGFSLYFFNKTIVVFFTSTTAYILPWDLC